MIVIPLYENGSRLSDVDDLHVGIGCITTFLQADAIFPALKHALNVQTVY